MSENTAQKHMRELRAAGAVGTIKSKKGGLRLYPAENVEVDAKSMVERLPGQVLVVRRILSIISKKIMLANLSMANSFS